jgi:replication-associated recombination protein RarA
MFDTDDTTLNALWVEKYRPKTIEEIILPDDQKKFLSDCMHKQDLPHCLFIGPAGGGKCHDGSEKIEIYIED